MVSLLTHDEYRAIAASANLPTGAFIDGSARRTAAGTTLHTVDPSSGAVLAEIAACGVEEVNFAVTKAREAFDDGRWRMMHPTERKKVMIQWTKLIRRNAREIAVLESVESGKPIREVETVDLPETLHCLEWHAETADKIYDQISPSGDDALSLVVREPIGVVACVLPWNFPILMAAWKLGPSLAAGNSVLVKPAEETNMATLRLAELAQEAGLPRGVLAILPGEGAVTGKALGQHMDVDMVSFTGSTEIGRKFLEYSAQSNLKRVVLECGGKNPCVVMDDAEDLDEVAIHATNGMLWNMGENCSASSRLIVHRAVKQPLLERIRHRIGEWRMGDPLDPANRLGALVSERHYATVTGYIEKGIAEGGELLLGGLPNGTQKNGKGTQNGQGSGFFVSPTVFGNVTPDMTLAREEVFGPVLAVLEVGSEDEAVLLANDTAYGLAASVFTGNLKRAHRMARAIRAGTVSVNCFGEGDATTPFGGFKQSGFGGRDKSIHAHDQYTELKTIWINLSDEPLEDSLH